MGLGAGTVERVVAMWERWEHEPRPDDRLGFVTLGHQMVVRVRA
jgi:hypothetical protein